MPYKAIFGSLLFQWQYHGPKLPPLWSPSDEHGHFAESSIIVTSLEAVTMYFGDKRKKTSCLLEVGCLYQLAAMRRVPADARGHVLNCRL